MYRMTVIATVLLGCLAVLSIHSPVQAGGDETRLEGRLSPTSANPQAEGRAKFEIRPDRVRASVEVRGVSASSLDIVVNGVTVAVVGVSGFGFADWNVDSRDGDGVPDLQSGDSVEVFNSDNGMLLLSGALSSK